MKKLILTLLAILLLAGTAFAAANVTLRWDRNNEPDLAKYTLFWRAPDGIYVRNTEAPLFHEDVTVLVVNSTDDTEHPRQITVFLPNNDYEFVVTATDNTGNESGYSNQVDTVKPQPPGNLTIFEIIWAFIKRVFNWFA